VVVVIFAILGADPLRDRRRLVAAAVVTAWFLCRMPWWGITWLNDRVGPVFFGRLLQNADTAGALIALAMLAWTLQTRDDHDPGTAPEPGLLTADRSDAPVAAPAAALGEQSRLG
jgi:alpha-1,2-mannosyltransferase